MRLLCQYIALRANNEDGEGEGEGLGRFWQSRFKAVRILDEEALLACVAYVDLNPIRAALAETLEESDYTLGAKADHCTQVKRFGRRGVSADRSSRSR